MLTVENSSGHQNPEAGSFLQFCWILGAAAAARATKGFAWPRFSA